MHRDPPDHLEGQRLKGGDAALSPQGPTLRADARVRTGYGEVNGEVKRRG